MLPFSTTHDRGRQRARGAIAPTPNFWKSENCQKILLSENFRLKMRKVKLRILILKKNFGAKLNFWAPVIFSVGNLHLSVKILSQIRSFVAKLQLPVSLTFLTNDVADAR